MSLSYAQLERFYEGLVLRAREQGVICAITSGMACVAWGVAQATKDCDLLCAPESLDGLFRIVRETKLEGADAGYRATSLRLWTRAGCVAGGQAILFGARRTRKLIWTCLRSLPGAPSRGKARLRDFMSHRTSSRR